jgi:hypothetical protein
MILALAASSSGMFVLWQFIVTVLAMVFFVVIAARIAGLPGLVVSVAICVIISVILMAKFGTQ